MKKLSIIILFFLLAAACGRKEKSFMPEHLLSEQEMIDVLTDVQIIEADINRQKTQERERDPNDTTKVVAKDYVAIARDYYAQLFEHSHFDRDGMIVFDRDEQAVAYVQQYATELAQFIPAVLEMDYPAFYEGTHEEVAAKYRLAWAIAYFLEVGAPKIRMRPFENVRADYLKELVRTRSMHEATAVVLNDDRREAFAAAWLDFWKHQ